MIQFNSDYLNSHLCVLLCTKYRYIIQGSTQYGRWAVNSVQIKYKNIRPRCRWAVKNTQTFYIIQGVGGWGGGGGGITKWDCENEYAREITLRFMLPPKPNSKR